MSRSIVVFLVVAAMLDAGGWIWDWYHQVWWFDEFSHFFTPFALLAAISYVSSSGAAGGRSRLDAVISIAARAAVTGLVIGIIWELFEATFIDMHWLDTLSDVVLDVIGAALGGCYAVWLHLLREQT